MAAAKPSLATLFVSELHDKVTEAVLYETFSVIGQIASIRVCHDVASGRFLGCAYINFQQPPDTHNAIDNINFETMLGSSVRFIWCQWNIGGRNPRLANVFIKDLPLSIDCEILYSTFTQFGTILSCKVCCNERGPRGCGFVNFQTQEAANKAIRTLNSTLLKGQKVSMQRWSKKKKEGRSKELRNFSHCFRFISYDYGVLQG
ncbi:polyadenylate-binding protein 1-like 2 [Gastrophryne carolinensis]